MVVLPPRRRRERDCKRFLDIYQGMCYILIKLIRMDIIASLNPIDAFFLILCLGISYNAVRAGVIGEIVKAIGLFVSALGAFHYYPLLAERITEKFPFLHSAYDDCLSFLCIFSISTFVFFLVRKTAFLFFRKGEISFKERATSLCIGWGRFVFFASTLIFAVSLAPLYRKIDPTLCVNRTVETYTLSQANL
jgi:uncharacterized membrane protein required for colicin V production